MSEIGIFYRTIIEEEEDKKVENLTDLWIGSNLQYEGLQEVLDSISSKRKQKKLEGPTQKEIDQNWRRLAAMGNIGA